MNESNILIPNKFTFLAKLSAMCDSGADKLHVVSDFDRTITRCYDDEGRLVPSTLGLTRHYGVLGEEYSKKGYELFDEYHPKERDESLSMEERSVLMREWWAKHMELNIEFGYSKAHVQQLMEMHEPNVREGFDKFIKIIDDADLPLVVFSAGNGDYITEYFSEMDFLKDNVHVIANFLKFDPETGKAIGYEDDLIHTFNKDESHIENYDFKDDIKSRKNVILIGDSTGDSQMNSGTESENILKIGFFNLDKSEEDFDEKLAKYLELFDMVLLNDSDFGPINNILESIVKGDVSHF